MEGDHWAPMSRFLMGKWIVRERSVGPHLCLDSSISLFIFPPTWSGRHAKFVHLCVRVGLFDLTIHCKLVMHAH